jgi:hypothetical protein
MPYKDPNNEQAKLSRKNIASRYYEKHKAEIAEKCKTDPNRVKALRINNWKRRGVIGDLDELYKTYLETEKCNNCDYIFIDSKNKCLDHNHEDGYFRQILCRNCNNWDKWKKTI